MGVIQHMAAWLRQLGPLTVFVFMLLKMAHYGLSGVTATTGHLKCHAVFRCKRKSFFLFKTFSIWRMYRSKKLSHFLFWDWNWTCSAVDIVSEQTKQKSLVYRKLNSTDRYHPPIQKKTKKKHTAQPESLIYWEVELVHTQQRCNPLVTAHIQSQRNLYTVHLYKGKVMVMVTTESVTYHLIITLKTSQT